MVSCNTSAFMPAKSRPMAGPSSLFLKVLSTLNRQGGALYKPRLSDRLDRAASSLRGRSDSDTPV